MEVRRGPTFAADGRTGSHVGDGCCRSRRQVFAYRRDSWSRAARRPGEAGSAAAVRPKFPMPRAMTGPSRNSAAPCLAARPQSRMNWARRDFPILIERAECSESEQARFSCRTNRRGMAHPTIPGSLNLRIGARHHERDRDAARIARLESGARLGRHGTVKDVPRRKRKIEYRILLRQAALTLRGTRPLNLGGPCSGAASC